jgi:hypothetical protein
LNLCVGKQNRLNDLLDLLRFTRQQRL